MTRWEKLSDCLLRVADELRMQGGALRHLSSQFGRSLDVLDRIESRLEETHASHEKSLRFQAEIDARLAKLERGPSAAE